MRDKHRPERPAEAVTSTIAVTIEVFVKKDNRVSLQEITRY